MTARGIDIYDQVPGYFSARDALHALRDRGEVDQHESYDPTKHHLFSLAGVRAPDQGEFNHEAMKGEFYTALKLSGRLIRATHCFPQRLYDTFPVEAKIQPDLITQLQGVSQDVYFEVDMGTEKPRVLANKFRKYVELDRCKLVDPFVVIVTVHHAPKRSNYKRRMEQVLFDILKPLNRGKQFLVAPDFQLRTDVFGKHLYAPNDPMTPLSLTDL